MFKKKYSVEVYCNNCASQSTLKIPKGTFVYEFLKDRKCVCKECGCRVRETVDERINPDNLERQHKQELERIRSKINNG